MVRRRTLMPALVVVAALLTAAPATAAPASSDLADKDPLSVTIDSLSPSVIPDKGRVTISGTVTNTSDETWIDVNVYPLTSTAPPMTTVAELDAAAQAGFDLVVGERVVEVSNEITELAPGQVAPYVLKIPRAYLGRTEGVHWLGVHTLAQNDEGRDDIADGKARTFLPLIEKGNKSVEGALVLQLRRRIDYTADGRIEHPDRWANDLGLGGRLDNLVELGASAGSGSITWLLDPAVVDAVASLVAGNPSRLPPPSTPEADPTDDAGATGESQPPATVDAPLESEATDPTDPTALAAAAVQGQAWISRLLIALAGQEILTLPYGDVDASAASHLDPALLADAHATSAAAIAAQGFSGTPAVGSPSGYLSPAALVPADPATIVLVSNSAVGIDAPTVVDIGGRQVVLTSSTAVQGGPGPDDPLAAVAMRQRILSEAAVRLLGPGREPLVVALPTDWAPEDLTDFLPGLAVPWLDLGPLSEIIGSGDRPPQPVALEDYKYPAFQETYELDTANFDAADGLRVAGDTIQQVLIEHQTVGQTVSREAFSSASYWQRATDSAAEASAERSTGWIRSSLGRVTIEGPPSVTLSSATGAFPATIRNGLDEPVRVRIDAVASGGVVVEVPDVFDLDPGESTRLRLSATTGQVGTHSVRLVVAAADGTPLGSTAELPIRSNQVSRIIWIVIVAGGGLLFGAIAVRLLRRVRRARADARALMPTLR